jgi:hypothetical protein
MPSTAALRRGVGLLALAAAVALAAKIDTRPLDDLTRAREAGADLQSESGRLADGLQDVSEGIEAASGLGHSSHQIERLTVAQGKSLERVERLISRQHGSLSATVALLARVEAASRDLADGSAAQARTLHETLGHLGSLRAWVTRANRTTTRLAKLARYSALLAEDSARSFSSR